MKKIMLCIIGMLSTISSSVHAGEKLCKGVYIDTVAIEARRVDGASQIGQSLLVSFKDASGNFYNCGGAMDRYVYLKAAANEAVFNAMVSMAFMAKANNYKVNFTINEGSRIYSADELAFIHIVENAALPNVN
ncbi:hypothetical protein CJF42_15130 [Pseudoalteromonas sp. NBT06-2]|uniref:hypothetical protein n=1 Tax=Pseudoalteromonas sp. NBT06-2 TaxID=2025950 RepID=UPI000BA60201|nr:hypothetical protein [Pseudoalteromonas sp. NBT06-2]PAJ73594.1 hypothetical protein CJF42_15130 [Pseudoalteromonas sp. NBT06-2]